MESVHCPISDHARHTPHHPALISRERVWTYRQLDGTVHSLCRFLENVGIKENDRVAFIASSSPQTIFLFFALFRLRAIGCPLSFRIPQDQIPSYLQSLNPSHILEPATLPLGIEPTTEIARIPLDQLATFLFTSGSSGNPKIACHTFANHYYNAVGAIPPLQLDPSSRYLLSLPLFHVSGIGTLFRCFICGATLVLSTLAPIEAILEFDISHISLVPTQLYRLFKESPASLEKIEQSLKCILVGGAPLSNSLRKEAQQHNLPVLTTYGMTEMGSIITLSAVNDLKDSGRVVVHRDLKIEEDQEIWVSGKTLFQGYWDPLRKTIVKADQEGWFPTKDLGRSTADHHLEVIGRKDRQFISGGENIQPEEIERALCSIPGIRQASVLPVADAEFGARPIAFIDDETGSHSLDGIRAALRSSLPSFMHPIHIFPYPSTEVGIKPDLAALKSIPNSGYSCHKFSPFLELPAKNRE